MLLKLNFNADIRKDLYHDISKFIYKNMLEDIRILTKKKSANYKMREPLLFDSNLIDWVKKPKSLDLVDYVNNSIKLNEVNGTYEITLDESKKVRGSNTKVSKLVRLLEFGTLEIKELPVLRRVFLQYKDNYHKLVYDYFKEEMI